LIRRILTLFTVGIWAGILVAGLWPFNFVPRNHVRSLPDGGGLGFDGYGQIYSAQPITPLAIPPDAAIELVFTPAHPYGTASTVFALINRGTVNFAIGQSLTDLFVQGSFTSSAGKPLAKLWLNRVCSKQELFVTVTMAPHHVDVYLDGRLVRSFPVSPVQTLAGKILIGHSASGTGYWSGTVARLAISDQTLDAAQITRRYQQWKTNRHLVQDVNDRGIAYEFTTPANDLITGVTTNSPALFIPRTFRLSRPNLLEWPEHFNRSVAIDALVNVAGFIPFGLFTCLCIFWWTRWGITRCVIMTILAGAAVSLAIELLQVLLPTRDSSLADVLTNILGAAIGAVMVSIRPVRSARPSDC